MSTFATWEAARDQLSSAIRHGDRGSHTLAFARALEAAQMLQEVAARSPLCAVLAASIAEVEDRKRRSEHPP